jgi:ABC-type bacteriocin/lantibiotic exporter with double-glycine peptidase domain
MFAVTFIFFFSLKKNLKRRGGLIITVQKNATNLITQCLNGIKYIKLANIEDKVTDILGKFVNLRNEQNAIKTFLSKTPKVFLEFFSIIVMIFVLFSLLNRGQEFSRIVPLLSFYVLVAIKE